MKLPERTLMEKGVINFVAFFDIITLIFFAMFFLKRKINSEYDITPIDPVMPIRRLSIKNAPSKDGSIIKESK
jgi:hypothetical protein